ncbi:MULTISPECIES: YcxB family protein [unclassified Massilia]|uniref:YcxB family protein n=1 Tax=unclassified Massilia TaxID=2609279 RepID=UPI001E52C586|nr:MULTISPECIES: YcxB family protein [unclassified Massilia]
MSSNHPGPANSTPVMPVTMQKSAEGADEGFFGAVGETPVLPSSLASAGLGALHFFVRYSLREYIGFMWQHGGFLIRRRRIRWPASLYLRIKTTLSAAFHFVMLGRGRRTYEFTIDEHGIVRTSGGVTLINWEDVMAVRTYSRGFMMVLKRGTLPIPFRCLDDAQRGVMRVLADARRDHALG